MMAVGSPSITIVLSGIFFKELITSPSDNVAQDKNRKPNIKAISSEQLNNFLTGSS
jgi:hypothetical protein